jgi:hypothetical protein
MPKRLHDSQLWSKQWFRVLTPAEKCAFQYLIDHCDGAGVWDADTAVADFVIGEGVAWAKLPGKVKGNIVVLDNGKFWLADFVYFQCGGAVTEATTNRAHKSYVQQLKKHGLYDRYLEKIRAIDGPNGGPKDNDNELELEIDKEKDKKEPDKELRPLIQYYAERHKEARGFEPSVDWARDMAIMKRLRSSYKPDAIRQCIDAFLDWKGRTRTTLRDFYSRIDTIYGVLKDKAEGKR